MNADLFLDSSLPRGPFTCSAPCDPIAIPAFRRRATSAAREHRLTYLLRSKKTSLSSDFEAAQRDRDVGLVTVVKGERTREFSGSLACQRRISSTVHPKPRAARIMNSLRRYSQSVKIQIDLLQGWLFDGLRRHSTIRTSVGNAAGSNNIAAI